MFSVVIPLYNKAAHIKQTLESVLNQTFADFEIVVVNDGSTDNSRDIVLGMGDPRIRLIDQDNAGVSAARNRGIEAARNPWIAFLDADDLWKPNKLEAVADAISTNENITWMVTGLETIKGTQQKDFLYNKEGFLEDGLEDLMAGLYIQTSSVIVKKDIFMKDQNLLFRVGVNNSEDREVWYKLIFKYPKLFYIRKILATYIRDAENSLASNPDSTMPFLKLGERLTRDVECLPSDRALKFKKFLLKFNRRALWYMWVRGTLLSGFENYTDIISNKDVFIMRNFSFMPSTFKLVLMKFLGI